jgi:hypothetical protein
MRADWINTSDKRKPQLPCGTNYGAYSRYVIPAGTSVRISRKGYQDQWSDHTTRQDLRFDHSKKTSDTGITFEHLGWLIWVRHDRIVKSQS